MRVAALLVGAGRGERLQAGLRARGSAWVSARGRAAGELLPKAFVTLGGRPLLEHAARALAAASEVETIVPVVPEACVGRLAELAPGLVGLAKLAPAVAGGAERQDSVAAGLAALPEDVGWVAVHDAARPLLRPADVGRVVAAAREHGAAILAVPARDTLKRVEGDRIRETPSRDSLWAAQTPQVFRVDWLREALAKAAVDGFQGTDCASLVERWLGPGEAAVRVVEGDPENLKVTGPEDLALAESCLAARSGE